MSQEAKIQRLTPCLLPSAGEGDAGLGGPAERWCSPRRALTLGSSAPTPGGGGLPAGCRRPGEPRVPSCKDRQTDNVREPSLLEPESWGGGGSAHSRLALISAPA